LNLVFVQLVESSFIQITRATKRNDYKRKKSALNSQYIVSELIHAKKKNSDSQHLSEVPLLDLCKLAFVIALFPMRLQFNEKALNDFWESAYWEN
jgi:hypothetical protein